MNHQRGPVIYASLVTTAFILAWVTLFSFERFGATEAKAWAPFLQAVLSAGAIIVAVLLQERKRKIERQDAAEALVLEFAAISRVLLRAAIFLDKSSKEKSTTQSMLHGHATIVAEDIQYLRTIKISALNDPESVRRALDFIRWARIFYAEIVSAQKLAEKLSHLSSDDFSKAFPKNFFSHYAERMSRARGVFIGKGGYQINPALADVGGVRSRAEAIQRAAEKKAAASVETSAETSEISD